MTPRQLLYRAFSFLGRKQAIEFAAATENFKQSQSESLQNILVANKNSVYGREHQFATVQTIEDFQKAVPISDYSGFEPYIQRCLNGEPSVLTSDEPVMFATTSGTSASPKFIPVTQRYIKEFRRASVVSGYHLLRDYPGLASGVVFSMTSSACEGFVPCGKPYGAISGLLFKEEPWPIRKFVSPVPYEAYLLKDYETRYYSLLRIALQLPVSCLYTLNPSTIRMLVRKLNQYGGKLIEDIRNGTITPPATLDRLTAAAIRRLITRDSSRARFLEQLLNSGNFKPHKIWPGLQVVSCWTKASASFYLEEFPEYFGSVPIEDISYGASEGRGTVYGGSGKQVLAINSHFFEFIPEEEIERKDPTVLLGCDLEEGKNYYILFTTSAGLYRYHINDVVKVVGFEKQAPLLEFQYKGGNICSFTGEKITELQMVQAMTSALQALGLSAAFFTVVPQFKRNYHPGSEPHYEIWVELSNATVSSTSSLASSHRRGADTPLHSSSPLAHLANKVDETLCRLNVEYKTKRESGRLGTFEAYALAVGSYEHLRKHLCSQQIADSQIKVSHLNPRPEIRDFLAANLSTPNSEAQASEEQAAAERSW